MLFLLMLRVCVCARGGVRGCVCVWVCRCGGAYVRARARVPAYARARVCVCLVHDIHYTYEDSGVVLCMRHVFVHVL